MEGKLRNAGSAPAEKKQSEDKSSYIYRTRHAIKSFFDSLEGDIGAYAGKLFDNANDGASRELSNELSNELSKEISSAKSIFRSIFMSIVLFAGALIVSTCFFTGCGYPLVPALICAAGEYRRGKKSLRISDNAAGAVISAAALFSCVFMKEGQLISFFVFSACFLCRVAFTKGAMNEGIGIRCAVAASGAVCRALIIGVLHGISGSDVLYAVFSGLAAAAFTFLLCGFHRFENAGLIADKALYRTAAVGAVIFSVIYAVRGINILGFRLAFVGGAVLTLCAGACGNAFYGAVCGMLCGAAAGLSADAYAAAMLAAAGFCIGFLIPVSKIGALSGAFISGAAFCILTGGIKSFYSCGADFLAAILIFFFMMRIIPVRSGESSSGNIKEICPPYALSPFQRTSGEAGLYSRIKDLSAALGSLSSEFTSLSDRLRIPQLTHATHIVSTSASSLCSGCGLSGICWGKEYTSTQDVTLKLAKKLSDAGEVSEDDLPGFFREKCVKSEELVKLINSKYDRLCGEWLKNDRAQMLSGEYNTVSRLLKSTAEEYEAGSARNYPSEKLARAVLGELGISYKAVFAYGARALTIDCTGVYPSTMPASGSEIKEAFEKKLGGCFSEPEFVTGVISGVMRMKRTRRISLECAKLSRAKNGETVNGDTVSFFENQNDFFYTCVCDGMGSGRDAALTSRLAAVFIEKLLTSSGEKSITLEMLNGFLLAKNGESFSTVDLLEIDLLDARASFIKAGAAPSYVIRAGRLYKISSATPPAGIIGKMTAEQTRLGLDTGDTAVLLSDGIEDGDIFKLPELLSGASPDISPAELAKLIMDSSSVSGRGDDMSVAVIKIRAAS